MAGVSANIVVGAPSLVKIGAYGGGIGAAVDAGYTEGGLKILSATEHFFHTVDQEVGQVGVTKLSEVRTTEVLLAEPTLVNLALAEGYPGSAVSGGDTLNIGGSDTVTLREMFITGRGPGGASRLITLHKIVVLGQTEYPMLKGDKTGVKLAIALLQDTSKSADQQYYSIVDSGGDVTPPTVAMTLPVEGGTIAAGTKNVVTLTFTEAGSQIDEGSLIYGKTILINNIEVPLTTSLKAGSIVYNSATKTMIFTPTAVWEALNTNFQVIITTAVRDTAGNYLAGVFYGHFVTAA